MADRRVVSQRALPDVSLHLGYRGLIAAPQPSIDAAGATVSGPSRSFTRKADDCVQLSQLMVRSKLVGYECQT